MKFESKILKIIQRTDVVKSFIFKRPDEFNFKAGQYILVTLNIDGVPITKPLTISSSPTQYDFLEFTKKLTGHPYSNVLNAMKIDNIIEISGPFGNFVFEEEYPKIALLCGGIGVTPMVSICKYCTDLELNTNIKLIYSNKTEHDIAFMSDLNNMEYINSNLNILYTLTRADDNWIGCRERICENLILKEVPDYKERYFYICGPPSMIKSVEELLLMMNIPKDKIKKESLIGY